MLFIEDYALEYKLGSGSFADVYYTTKRSTKQVFATKRVDKNKALSDKMKNYFLNEVEILKNTDHRNIIKLEEVKNSAKNFYLIMEYCNGGTLHELFEKYFNHNYEPFPESYVQHILRQVSSGLHYLHKSNIIHRDLKMENILLNFYTDEDKKSMNILNAQVKIIDFGFAKYLNDSTIASSICGSPINMDPIILKALAFKQIGNDFGYTEKADMWSLGIMVYTMLIGMPPFIASNYEDLYLQINQGNYNIPKRLKLSKEAISLINGLIQFDSKERLSIDELIFHQFLTKNIDDFEYCDLDYIDKGNRDITLNNKNDVNKIWDNYQLKDDINLNLSLIRGNLGQKSIINELNYDFSHNNGEYDSNKNFQAFYIDVNNNLIFTNKNPDIKITNEDKGILDKSELIGNYYHKNDISSNPNDDLTTKFNIFSTSDINKEKIMNNRGNIDDKIKFYEDQSNNIKKVKKLLDNEFLKDQNMILNKLDINKEFDCENIVSNLFTTNNNQTNEILNNNYFTNFVNDKKNEIKNPNNFLPEDQDMRLISNEEIKEKPLEDKYTLNSIKNNIDDIENQRKMINITHFNLQNENPFREFNDFTPIKTTESKDNINNQTFNFNQNFPEYSDNINHISNNDILNLINLNYVNSTNDISEKNNNINYLKQYDFKENNFNNIQPMGFSELINNNNIDNNAIQENNNKNNVLNILNNNSKNDKNGYEEIDHNDLLKKLEDFKISLQKSDEIIFKSINQIDNISFIQAEKNSNTNYKETESLELKDKNLYQNDNEVYNQSISEISFMKNEDKNKNNINEIPHKLILGLTTKKSGMLSKNSSLDKINSKINNFSFLYNEKILITSII